MTAEGVCAETESWRRDTVYHAISGHPGGVAMANSTCLVVSGCPEDVMFIICVL